MTQVGRNLTAVGDGFLRGSQHIILDRDPLDIKAFRRLLRDSGVTPLTLPAWSPNLNAFAERFVESAKSECLDRMVLLGEGHLRAAVREFVHHYHEERPHQGLGNEFISPKDDGDWNGPDEVSRATRRPAQVPLPRGRVIHQRSFRTERDSFRRLGSTNRNSPPTRCVPASPCGVQSTARGDAGVYGFAACLSLNRAPRRMPSIP